MAEGLYGFRVKVDASEVRRKFNSKFFMHIDYIRHKTIGDVVSSVRNIIKSKKNLVLFVEDYYLPASESIHALRDGDNIKVFCKATLKANSASITESDENDVEWKEWKTQRENFKNKKEQKKSKYEAETSDCITDLSNLKGNYDNGTFNQETTGNLESEQESMLVNCPSLSVSRDECQTQESFRTPVKASEIETDYEHMQVETNKEDENLKCRKIEGHLRAKRNSFTRGKKEYLKKYSVGYVLSVLKAAEGEPAHAFTYNKTKEQIVTQNNTLCSPDKLSSEKGAVPWTENKTEECVSLEGEAVDKEFRFPQTNDSENLCVPQSGALFENKRKRKRIRRHKKSKIQKLDSQNSTPIKNFAIPEIKAEERPAPSRKHIRFADDVETNVEVGNILVSPTTVELDNLENSIKNPVKENVTAETSKDAVADLTTQNSFTSQKNEADKLNFSLEENVAKLSTQLDVISHVPDGNAFHKLLSLGSSTPLVYERKKPIKTDTATISKDDETKKVDNFTWKTSLMNLPEDTKLSVSKITSFPSLETLPKKKDILAFKKLRIGEDYSPQLSDYIVAEVKHFDPDSQQLELCILQGADQCASPKGKFNIETDKKKTETNAEPEVLDINWKDLVGPRLLFP